jgi:hypothetical protein
MSWGDAPGYGAPAPSAHKDKASFTAITTRSTGTKEFLERRLAPQAREPQRGDGTQPRVKGVTRPKPWVHVKNKPKPCMGDGSDSLRIRANTLVSPPCGGFCWFVQRVHALAHVATDCRPLRGLGM